MKTFRLQLRFLVPLVIILAGTAYLALPLMDKLTLRWFARDLDMRGTLIANAMADSVTDALQDGRARRLQTLFDRALEDERLVALGWCSEAGEVGQRTKQFPPDLTCAEAKQLAAGKDPALKLESGPVHISVHPITIEAGPMGSLVLMHDLSFIE